MKTQAQIIDSVLERAWSSFADPGPVNRTNLANEIAMELAASSCLHQITEPVKFILDNDGAPITLSDCESQFSILRANKKGLATTVAWVCGDADVADELMGLLNAASQPPAATPAAHWQACGAPDPHGSRYDCARAALAMGHLTDDELANGVFMNYDRPLDIAGIMQGTASSPIAWVTAAKDRIRWLSRMLVTARADGALDSRLIASFHQWTHQQGGPAGEAYVEAMAQEMEKAAGDASDDLPKLTLDQFRQILDTAGEAMRSAMETQGETS